MNLMVFMCSSKCSSNTNSRSTKCETSSNLGTAATAAIRGGEPGLTWPKPGIASSLPAATRQVEPCQTWLGG